MDRDAISRSFGSAEITWASSSDCVNVLASSATVNSGAIALVGRAALAAHAMALFEPQARLLFRLGGLRRRQRPSWSPYLGLEAFPERQQPRLDLDSGSRPEVQAGGSLAGKDSMLASVTSSQRACELQHEALSSVFTWVPKNTTTNDQRVAEINLQGGLFNLPAGEVRAAVGATHREQKYNFVPDELLLATFTLFTSSGRFGDRVAACKA